tara:strand:- start:286 stop:528 length:243 start_codon:yes stop_codon:yes gene_type:complete
MKVMNHKEKIGIALTEEEMSLTIRALTITLALLSLIDKLGLTTGITESSNKWLSNLKGDYNKIYEDYKETKKESEFISKV